jgi:predicted transcriptional regulator
MKSEAEKQGRKKSISITLDSEVNDALNEVCEKRFLKKSAIANSVLKDYLKKKFKIEFNRL